MMLLRSWSMARRGWLQGLPRGVSLLGLQAAEEFLHLRRDIAMVMDDLPSPVFPAVDVGDAVVERECLARHRRLPALGADLVGQVSASAQELVVQPYLPARANVGYLLPHGS